MLIFIWTFRFILKLIFGSKKKSRVWLPHILAVICLYFVNFHHKAEPVSKNNSNWFNWIYQSCTCTRKFTKNSQINPKFLNRNCERFALSGLLMTTHLAISPCPLTLCSAPPLFLLFLSLRSLSHPLSRSAGAVSPLARIRNGTCQTYGISCCRSPCCAGVS